MNRVFKTANHYFKNELGVIVTIGGLVALYFGIKGTPVHAVIGLAFFCLTLIILLVKTLIIIRSFKNNFDYFNTELATYDKAILKFGKPLSLNDYAAIDISFVADNFDNSAVPLFIVKIEHPLEMLRFRIELFHREICADARLSRKRVDADNHVEFELIELVIFDKESRSFEKTLFNPSSRYFYKLEWDSL